MTEENSVQLWEEFRAGNARALAALFETYYEALYHYGLKLTGDEELVKDCIQNLGGGVTGGVNRIRANDLHTTFLRQMRQWGDSSQRQ